MAVGALLFVSMVPVTLLVAPLKELVGDRFGASPFWTHSFMSMNMIGAIMAAPLIGRWSDTRGRRARVAAWALVADAVLLAGMSFAPNLIILLALRCFEGVAHILAISTLMATAAGWAGEGKRGRTMGIIGAAMMFGTACGTRMGGAVWRHMGDWTFCFAGAVSLIAAIGVLLTVAESSEDRRERSKSRSILSLLRQKRELIVPYLYTFVDRFCVGVVISTFVLFLAEVHDIAPKQRGSLLAMFLVPFALLVYPAGRLVDRVGRAWPIALGSMLFGLVFAAYGVVEPVRLGWLMLASGVVSAAMFAPSLALCADLAPQDQRGAAFTGFNAAGSLGMLMGPIVSGAFFTVTAARLPMENAYAVTFIATGCAQFRCAALTLPLLLRLSRNGVIR